MLDGLRVCLKGLNSVRHQGYVYIWANLLFLAFSVPLVTLPAAYSALFRVAYNAQTRSYEADLDVFWSTFRENLWRFLPWGVLNVVFVVLFVSNWLAYAGDQSLWVQGLRAVWWFTGLIWGALMIYTFPIYYEMEQPNMTQALLNALLMALKNPIFTVTILAILIIIAVISTLLIAFWAVLTWSAFAAIGTAAVRDRLARYRSSQDDV